MPSKDKKDTQERDVMTINDVADYLKLGRRSIYKLVQSGQLPGRKILNRWRFYRKDVESWLRKGAGYDVDTPFSMRSPAIPANSRQHDTSD